MNDKDYFLKYKQSFEMIFLSNTDDCAFIKDSNLKYQAITLKQMKMFGLKSSKEILGKTFADIAKHCLFCDEKLIAQLIKQDLLIQQTKKRKIYLEILYYNGDSKIYVHYKNPIINPDTNNCVGIRGQMNNLILPHIIKFLFKMHGAKNLLIVHKNNSKKNFFEEYPLTSSQRMVLFLALNNYSYSEIAILLNEFGHQITPVRVNDYLEQLKFIFHVRNKNQLIEKAIGLNFHTLLPDELFNKFISLEIGDEETAIIYHDHDDINKDKCSKTN